MVQRPPHCTCIDCFNNSQSKGHQGRFPFTRGELEMCHSHAYGCTCYYLPREEACSTVYQETRVLATKGTPSLGTFRRDFNIRCGHIVDILRLTILQSTCVNKAIDLTHARATALETTVCPSLLSMFDFIANN